VKITIKVDPDLNRAYWPKALIEEGFTGDIDTITNARAGVFWPASADLKDVVKSLEIILADIRHREELEKKGAKK